jgi:hypothetical protein
MSPAPLLPVRVPRAGPAAWRLADRHQGLPSAAWGSPTESAQAQELAAAYADAGGLILRSLVAPARCAALKAEASAVLARASPGSTVHVGLSVVSRAFRALHADARLVAALASLMPAGVAFLSDKAVFKSAAQRFATPLHIDAFYWPGTRPKLSVWLALDAADERNGGLAVVPGSHRASWECLDADSAGTNGEFGRVLAGADQLEWIAPVLGAGDAVIFSDTLVHGSAANAQGLDRWSAILTYHAPAPDEAFDRCFAARRTIAQPGAATRVAHPASAQAGS